MNGTIYALVGPDGIRYVGMTHQSLKQRFQKHAREAAAGRIRHVYNWWRSLEQPPEIVELEICDVFEMHEREKVWIAFLRAEGFRLCNHTDGGQGGIPDEVTRRKISAAAKQRYKDPVERAKIGDANRRRWADPSARAEFGLKQRERFARDDYRQKMSAAINARFARASEREKVRETTRQSWASLTPEQYVARCAAMSAGRAKAKALREAML